MHVLVLRSLWHDRPSNAVLRTNVNAPALSSSTTLSVLRVIVDISRYSYIVARRIGLDRNCMALVPREQAGARPQGGTQHVALLKCVPDAN